MTDFVIPCETFYRISRVISEISDEFHPSWNTLRIDDGCLIATDRSFMAIENIGNISGIAHIIADPALIAQCETEMKFNSRLTITVNEMLKFAVAKTSLGYVTTHNILYTGEIDPAWQRWRAVVNEARTPAAKPNGAMFWAIDGIYRLLESSPSGKVVFEEVIDTSRPVLIRDVTDYHWLGIFQPRSSRDQYAPATLPTWIKPI